MITNGLDHFEIVETLTGRGGAVDGWWWRRIFRQTQTALSSSSHFRRSHFSIFFFNLYSILFCLIQSATIPLSSLSLFFSWLLVHDDVGITVQLHHWKPPCRHTLDCTHWKHTRVANKKERENKTKENFTSNSQNDPFVDLVSSNSGVVTTNKLVSQTERVFSSKIITQTLRKE